MAHNDKAIIGLQKQNDGMFSSLITRNIYFERTIITDNINREEHLKLLQEENIKLKDVINTNKPPPQPKQEKKSEQLQQQSLKKEKIPIDNEEEDDDDKDEVEKDEPKKNFTTIINMEEIKRAFFNGDYMAFEEQIKMYPFKFYKVAYKYDSDKDGAPDFSARNLLKGFVQKLFDYKKYFMVCFRCLKNQYEIKYKYESLWIVNTTEPIYDVIGSLMEDFDFIETTDIENFICQIKKLPEYDSDEPVYTNNYTCILESYVH